MSALGCGLQFEGICSAGMECQTKHLRSHVCATGGFESNNIAVAQTWGRLLIAGAGVWILIVATSSLVLFPRDAPAGVLAAAATYRRISFSDRRSGDRGFYRSSFGEYLSFSRASPAAA